MCIRDRYRNIRAVNMYLTVRHVVLVKSTNIIDILHYIITIFITVVDILTTPWNPGHLASRGWSCLDAGQHGANPGHPWKSGTGGNPKQSLCRHCIWCIFSLHYLTSGGNKFTNFPENQITLIGGLCPWLHHRWMGQTGMGNLQKIFERFAFEFFALPLFHSLFQPRQPCICQHTNRQIRWSQYFAQPPGVK